jgi:hypothetical protein
VTASRSPAPYAHAGSARLGVGARDLPLVLDVVERLDECERCVRLGDHRKRGSCSVPVAIELVRAANIFGFRQIVPRFTSSRSVREGIPRSSDPFW